jgi:hypothetical protein
MIDATKVGWSCRLELDTRESPLVLRGRTRSLVSAQSASQPGLWRVTVISSPLEDTHAVTLPGEGFEFA